MPGKRYMSAPQVRERYNCSDMTLWRWLHDEQLRFPKPITIRRRRLFDVDELDEFDRRQKEVA
jgi:excisionase family DNA binding protein